ncbi:IDEAL domain-containing protein [Bacillus velezensis]|uniref:IDEAL domain-containing protein n=1 Tax=Bacillus velezensis TaxID=492670 RepID=UPI0033942166
MKEKKSYTELMTELMKSRNTQKANEFDVTMADIYIQMVLDESLYKRRIAILTMQINKALDDKNKEAFLTLSKEYAALKQSE